MKVIRYDRQKVRFFKSISFVIKFLHIYNKFEGGLGSEQSKQSYHNVSIVHIDHRKMKMVGEHN